MNATANALSVPIATRIPWGFAEWFIISQTALPAILIMPGTQGIRLPIRVSSFILPLVAFVWWNLESEVETSPSRSQSWVFAVMFLLATMLFHPSTPSFMGGLAHVGVYFSVMAPLFWAPSLVRTPEHLARILWILLVCCGINAMVGVLQVYDPARWLPAEFSRISTAGVMGLGPVSYMGPNGTMIVRPPGLFDTPGSVAGPAAFAALLGMVFAVSALPLWKRAASLLFAGAGLAAIYLTQVRVSLVIAAGMMLVYLAASLRQGRVARTTQFAILAGGLFVGSFMLAFALGGQTIMERMMTLFASDPMTVYNGARGTHLDITFNQLFIDHPFGSGLGRWGMAAAYFGTYTGVDTSIWAEIQFTGWMIDGGILMVILYCGALVVAAVAQWQLIAHGSNDRLRQCAAVVLSANLGTTFLIFTFTPFVTQIGIQYWFLAGAMHGVAQTYGADGA